MKIKCRLKNTYTRVRVRFILFYLTEICLHYYTYCRYEKIYEEVQGLEPVRVFHGWMRVDGRSMKSALLNIIKKWSFMFKQHLIDHVTNR